MYFLFKRRSFIVGVTIVGLIALLGIFGPLVTKDPRQDVRDLDNCTESNKDLCDLAIFKPPGKFGILGTDQSGHDYLSQIAHGIQNSLLVGVVVAFFTIIIASIVGGVAAYQGGIVDEIAQLFTNIILVFPVVPALLVLAGVLEERSLWLIIIIISIISWPWAARAIRSQVLSLKEREFVALAKVSGKSNFRIAIFEILPHLLSYIALVFAISLGAAVLTEAGISVVGLGPENSITLGKLLELAITTESIRRGFWWIFVTPGLILTAFMFSLYLIQSNMDAVFNPRLREE